MRRGLIVLHMAVCLCFCLGGCKVYGEPCQRQMADCLRRCDRSGGTDDEALRPNDTRTECERNCDKCAPERSAANKPAGPPTLTGTAGD